MNSAPALQSVNLDGTFVSLEPLAPEHGQLLFEAAGSDAEDIFRWIPYPMRTAREFETWTATAFAEQDRGESMVFATRAKEEGTFRRHLITWTGRVRDTVYFSILDSEWPEVKARLESRLKAL